MVWKLRYDQKLKYVLLTVNIKIEIAKDRLKTSHESRSGLVSLLTM